VEADASGLVVVDMQNAFCQNGGMIYVAEAEAQLGTLAEVVQLARDAALPVIYTAVMWETYTDIPLNWRTTDPGWVEKWNDHGSLSARSWGADFPEVIAPRPGELVLRKKGFLCPSLGDVAIGLGLRGAFLTGTTANNCVYAAALSLFEANVAVMAIEDCISGFSDAFKAPWLSNISMFLGSVITAEQLRVSLGTHSDG
jgi:nicotinamidase-related amidase